MSEYTEKDFADDFDFFVAHHQELYNKYGQTYLAIRDKKVIGTYPTSKDALLDLSSHYPTGTFLLQKCTGDESAFANLIEDWQITTN